MTCLSPTADPDATQASRPSSPTAVTTVINGGSVQRTAATNTARANPDRTTTPPPRRLWAAPRRMLSLLQSWMTLFHDRRELASGRSRNAKAGWMICCDGGVITRCDGCLMESFTETRYSLSTARLVLVACYLQRRGGPPPRAHAGSGVRVRLSEHCGIYSSIRQKHTHKPFRDTK